MSRQGHAIALKHGEKLPAFASLAEAEQHYHNLRDKHLDILLEVATQYPLFHPDYSPESLKQLEQWYFRLYETGSFRAMGIVRETFETCMAMYFGETAIRSARAHWIVEQYFIAPNKYELGVRKDSVTMMVSRFTDHFREPNNKKKESLFRRYKKYFAQIAQSDLDKQLRALLR